MFKAGRWKSEKIKIKVVLKFQFEAIQVPHSGWDGLTVSLIPWDVGKPTAKSEKAEVRDGICRWGNAVYETVNFIKDQKSGKIYEKIYHFLLSTGKTKAGILGEASINLAEFAEGFVMTSVSLPLKGSNGGSILQVTIQRLQGSPNRQVGRNDMIEKLQNEKPRNLHSDEDVIDSQYSSNDDMSVIETKRKSNLGAKRTTSLLSDSNTDVRAPFSPDLMSASEYYNSSGEGENRIVRYNTPNSTFLNNCMSPASAVEGVHLGGTYSDNLRSDVEGSPNLYAKENLDEPKNNFEDKIAKENSEITEKVKNDFDAKENLDEQKNNFEDKIAKENSEIAEKVKNDFDALMRQIEVSELELQTLRKQTVKESKRGQDLYKEISSLRKVNDELVRECERLRRLQPEENSVKVKNRMQIESEDMKSKIEELKQELKCEKYLNSDLKLQLKMTRESNSEMMVALKELDELLVQKNLSGRKSGLCEFCIQLSESRRESYRAGLKTIKDDQEQHELDLLISEKSGEPSLEQELDTLYGEIERYRIGKEELEMQIEQLTLENELLKQENHNLSSNFEQDQMHYQLKTQYESSTIRELEDQVESLAKELETKVKTFEEEVAAITKAKIQQEQRAIEAEKTVTELNLCVETLEKEIEKQMETFEADLTMITLAKIEQEKRAIRAEDSLRRIQWNNVSKAERLQNEFKLISRQMSSTCEANEKVAMQALQDASELRQQKRQLEAFVEKINGENSALRDDYEGKVQNLLTQLELKSKEVNELMVQLKDKSMMICNQRKFEEEMQKSYNEKIRELKSEIETVAREKTDLIQQIERDKGLTDEIERLKASIEDTQIFIQQGKEERHTLEEQIASSQEEADKLQEELNEIKCQKDEKDKIVDLLQSEVTTLKSQYSELKHAFSKDKIENENLKKQAIHLTDNISKKEEMIAAMEKKLQIIDASAAASNSTQPKSEENRSESVQHDKESSLLEKIKLLESNLKTEGESAAYCEEDSEAHCVEDSVSPKLDVLATNFSSGDSEPKDPTSEAEKGDTGKNRTKFFQFLNIGKTITNLREDNAEVTKGEIDQEDPKDCSSGIGTFTEIESLKQKNTNMEGELKELQARYSELSLKFAEVEGERQQLIMTVRYLKHSRKK